MNDGRDYLGRYPKFGRIYPKADLSSIYFVNPTTLSVTVRGVAISLGQIRD